MVKGLIASVVTFALFVVVLATLGNTEKASVKRLIAMLIIVVIILFGYGGFMDSIDFDSYVPQEREELDSIKILTEHTYARPNVYIDTVTGVHYLSTAEGGVCVMVDSEGKPLVDKGE